MAVLGSSALAPQGCEAMGADDLDAETLKRLKREDGQKDEA